MVWASKYISYYTFKRVVRLYIFTSRALFWRARRVIRFLSTEQAIIYSKVVWHLVKHLLEVIDDIMYKLSMVKMALSQTLQRCVEEVLK